MAGQSNKEKFAGCAVMKRLIPRLDVRYLHLAF